MKNSKENVKPIYCKYLLIIQTLNNIINKYYYMSVFTTL